MKSHEITGSGGVRLHAVETGNPLWQSILFIHGISQNWLSWRAQLDSELQDEFRLVAVDLRGHGMSDKPDDSSYADSKVWADDVNAIIESLDLRSPILCGWSYGPLVILDYIRHYGEDAIGGMSFLGGVTKLGSEDAVTVLTNEFLSLIPGFFSTDVQESSSAMESLIRLCFTNELAEEDLYRMLGYNLIVPPYVRQAMLSRSLDNDDLLHRLQKPLLIIQGSADKIVRVRAAEEIKSAVKHATLVVMNGAGHALSTEEPTKYNARLRDFALGTMASAATAD
jgi:non-heme chloroperoxidase